MFMQQTFVSVGRGLPGLIAPAIIEDLNYDPAWVGIYFGILATASLVVQLGCGSFIIRYGAMRMSQLTLVMLAVGTGIATLGLVPLWILSGILCGGGGALSTPASSHLLGRYSPPRFAPLVFSIKQTAVPAGILIASLTGPALVVDVGWRGAMLVMAAGCMIFAVILQPTRAEFDSDRVPSRSFHWGDFKTTFLSVIRVPALRSLSFACFAFNGLQTLISAYFVIYLTQLGHSLAVAGYVFAVAMAVAVPGRIFWGWLGSVYVAPRIVQAGLALGMAASCAATAFFTPAWSLWLIGAVSVGISLTVISWHGVLLAEAARLAPEGMRGAVTGGVLSFGQVGAISMPLIYSALLALTGSYGIGFLVCGLPSLLVGIDLLRRGPAMDEAR